MQKGAKENCSTAAFLKLITFRERSRNAGCYNVTPLSESCCSNSLFTMGYIRLAEGEGKID
jgi:hypothetical protein